MHAPVPDQNDPMPEVSSDAGERPRLPPSDSDREYIADRIKAVDECVAYFGRGEEKKLEREKWIATRFAEDIGAPALTKPLGPSDDVTVDIFYDTARFQIKEMGLEGRDRHGEFKDAAKEYRLAKYAADTLSERALDDLSVVDIVDKVLAKLPKLKAKYQLPVRNSLDLLLYANFWCTTEDEAIAGCPSVDTEGWRSVCVLTNDGSFVLSAQSTAPEWIRSKVGAKCKRFVEPMPGSTHIRIRFAREDEPAAYMGLRNVSRRAGSLVARTIAELSLPWTCDFAPEFDDADEVEIVVCWGIDTSGYQEMRVPEFEAALNSFIGDSGLRIINKSVMP